MKETTNRGILRALCLLIAVLMLLPLAACGETAETPDVTTEAGSDAATEEATEFFPNVEKQDYEGETFQMIGIRDAGVWVYGEDPTAANVNVLNETLYEMNTTVSTSSTSTSSTSRDRV